MTFIVFFIDNCTSSNRHLIMSTTTNYNNKQYMKDSLLLLKYSFPRLSVDSIRRTLTHYNVQDSKNNHQSFTQSYQLLTRLDTIIDEEKNNPVSRQTLLLEVAFFIPNNANCTIALKRKRATTSSPPKIINPELTIEIQSIPQFHQGGVDDKENKNVQATTTKVKDIKHDTTPPQVEASIECECCYGDYSFEDMTQCDEGHLFCKDCLKSYVEEQVFGNNNIMIKCMSSSSNCPATFCRAMLEKALPSKVLQQLDEQICRVEIEKAKLNDLWQCPQCATQVCLPDNMQFVTCPIESCKHQSCRHCEKEPHPNKTCEQFKAEQVKSNAVNQMAEAMTESIIRKCPGCQKKIIKSDGCNKMTCPNCNTKFCYVCHNKVQGYEHFCQTRKLKPLHLVLVH